MSALGDWRADTRPFKRECVDVDVWMWMCGCGCVDVDVWMWMCGCVDVWMWMCGWGGDRIRETSFDLESK